MPFAYSSYERTGVDYRCAITIAGAMKKLRNDELGRLTPVEFAAVRKMPLVVVLDDVRSHLNVGSIFRSCDAFAVAEIVLCGITGTPPHRDIQKTALGATETVRWTYERDVNSAITRLKRAGCRLIAVEQTEGAVKLQQFETDFSGRLAVVFGNEVAGVKQTVIDGCDDCIEIPQSGTKHSLNVSVAAGVVLWHFYNKFQKAS